eukprot:Opistho-2@36217
MLAMSVSMFAGGCVEAACLGALFGAVAVAVVVAPAGRGAGSDMVAFVTKTITYTPCFQMVHLYHPHTETLTVTADVTRGRTLLCKSRGISYHVTGRLYTSVPPVSHCQSVTVQRPLITPC